MKARKRPIIVNFLQLKHPVTQHTLHGDKPGREGDYLVQGVEGEQYIVSKSVFEATYDILPDSGGDS